MERLIDAKSTTDDEQLELSIRPKILTEYIGQPTVREQLHIFIQAAKQREEALDHTLLFGPLA